MIGDKQQHWQGIYTEKSDTAVSWYQDSPVPSLDLLALTRASRSAPIIDIGGGASRFVDCLLDLNYSDVTVLDLSQAALDTARGRLGSKADVPHWIVANVTQWTPPRTYAVWHDRAAFHFLTTPSDQAAYAERLRASLLPEGYAIIGTFALDGPEKCSGLPVMRHEADTLGAILGSDFELVDTRRHRHLTPWGSEQRFQFSTFRRA